MTCTTDTISPAQESFTLAVLTDIIRFDVGSVVDVCRDERRSFVQYVSFEYRQLQFLLLRLAKETHRAHQSTAVRTRPSPHSNSHSAPDHENTHPSRAQRDTQAGSDPSSSPLPSTNPPRIGPGGRRASLWRWTSWLRWGSLRLLRGGRMCRLLRLVGEQIDYHRERE